MYKAIQVLTGEEIILLHPHWRAHLEELRALDRADRLVCQGCRQPLRVKAGPHKRPHFAHKHLQACSYGSESPEILLARAALYQALVGRFDPQSVTVERVLPGLPRPVDCWVETPAASLAYWVVDAGIKLEPRLAILSALSAPGIRPVYVMAHKMLNEVEEKDLAAFLARSRASEAQEDENAAPPPFRRMLELGRSHPKPSSDRLKLIPGRKGVLLTPTERALARPTPYDEPYAGERDPDDPWGTLYYLDSETEMLTAYRGLSLAHRPNWYQGVRMQGRLSQLAIDPKTGDFTFPGEEQRLAQFRFRRARMEKKRPPQASRETSEAAPAPPVRSPAPPVRNPDPPPPAQRWQLTGHRSAAEPDPLPCATCGQITTEYWSTFYLGDKKICRCRECLERNA